MMAGLFKSWKGQEAPHAATARLPHHVAIIMDGNGRWAKSRGLPRTAGHHKGAESVRAVLRAARQQGVRYLTFYAFSAENWQRPAAEVAELMSLLRRYLSEELPKLCEEGVRIRFIGDRTLLDADLQEKLIDAEARTRALDQLHVTVALSYGGRQEIVRAAQKLAQQVQTGALKPQDITQETLTAALDTHDLPEPDLLIRTGGDQRISNFLLWQSAYTEFYFTPTLWPDFRANEFAAALADYATRERRYGTAAE